MGVSPDSDIFICEMKSFLSVFVVALGLGASSWAQQWETLFDGKTLNGWVVKAKPEDAARGFWSVKDGAITADSLGRKDHDYVWLMNEREFGDFELELEVLGFKESPGNSGVQVRSRYDDEARWLDGPQADVHPPAPWRTGLIYDETRGAKRWIFPSLKDWNIDESHAVKGWKWNVEGWNKLRVVCDGTRIRTWVNGVPIADLDGKGLLDDEAHKARNAGLRGHIALQLHTRDELKIQYRGIRIRKLR